MTDFTREDMRERIAEALDRAGYGWPRTHQADAIMRELGLWEAYEALDVAVAYLETLHSLAPAKDARALAWKRLKAARAALARLRGEPK